MDSMNLLTETLKLSEGCDENSQIIDFGVKNWNCVTSKAFLACYFEHFKEEEENRDGTIRSKSVEEKELTCSIEEFQQSALILMEDTWYEQLCKCLNCLQIYQKQNVNFQFGIRNIEWLPTEILLIIFKCLLPSDRRTVSECCKRFLDIWLCDDFADDRRLVFDYCVLDPEQEPLSVFLKSERTYRNLAFGDVRIRGESIFAEKFWENVTTIELLINFKSVNKNLSFLSQFPNLKTLEVAYIQQLGVFSDVPITIELLVIPYQPWIDVFSGIGDKLNMLKCYLDKTSNSFRVELNLVTTHILDFTEAQRNKIQRIYLFVSKDDKTIQLPRLNNLKYLTLDFSLLCNYGTEKIFDNLEEQYPALKDLSINIWHRLPHKNWTCLKTLKAAKIQKEEMSRINIFKNLKELSLLTLDDCFFVHETFLNKNLKTLKINSPTNPCFTCFQTMTESFPNLESFTCNFRVTNGHLEELATKTPKLKRLDLERVDASVSFVCLPNLTELRVNEVLTIHLMETWPIMFRLRELTINFSHLNFETVTIFERTPALQDLSVICDEIDGDQLALFDALTKPLKRLNNIYFNCERIQREIYPKIIDVMANNCKYLRRINCRDQKTYQPYASKEILKQLLQKHPSIRCIDDVWLK